MKNVYDLVENFFDSIPSNATFIISKSRVDKFFRTQAWKGIDNDKLIEQWQAVRMLLLNMIRWHYDDFFYLSTSDYQEIVFQYLTWNDISLTERNVAKFFSRLKPFFRFATKTDRKDEAQFYERTFRDAKKSFYLYDKFLLPRRRDSEDEFYIQMEHDASITPQISDELNKIIDNLLVRIKNFFHSNDYSNDLSRAFGIYYGPIGQTGKDQMEIDKENNFTNFWDFFMFDYHTIKDDITPILQFYQVERENLTYTEDQILRDLMGTELTIFYVESQSGDTAICRNLFSDEILDLPLTSTATSDIKRMIFLGHIRSEGVMLLDHIIATPASPKLRERMKQEILRAFELFKYQKPNAKLKEFFSREAAMVRHILRVLSEFAQLNIVPLKEFPKPIQTRNEKIPATMLKGWERLRSIGKSLGISKYGLHLLMKLYSDFIFVCPGNDQQKQSDSALLAVLYLFHRANDISTKNLESLTRESEQLRAFSLKLTEVINSVLHIAVYDPRYAFEDGFVCMLFLEEIS